MLKKIKEIVIPKEQAVFWLDKDGFWHNEHGKFEHKKIIDYFHSCIRRDHNGYYLCQQNESFREKVYFPYEDQALFVFDVIRNHDIILVLNTKKQVKLKPKKLFIKNDSLYMRLGDETVKFSEQGLLKIAPLLEDENGQLFVHSKNRRYKIPVADDSWPSSASGSPDCSGTNDAKGLG